MILLFLRQHRAWLLFSAGLQLVVNLIFFVDEGIEGVSLLYMNAVWLLLLALFLLFRYAQDVRAMQLYEKEGANYIQAVKQTYEERLLQQKVQMQQQRLVLLERQDELLAWVHEMKSPMTAMQLLIEKMAHDEMKERFETEWLRLYLLLDQQLHATRLMTIEQDNRMEQVALQEVLIAEVQALRSWCFEKQLAIELEGAQTVVTDRKWLGFIVRQILSNAVKYSHVGGEITLSITNDEQAVIVIKDCGVGIAAEDLPRVFRKSYTGTIGRETSAATGMGLYLAQQAAKSLNVKLCIDSTERVGTAVTIRFPKEDTYTKTLR